MAEILGIFGADRDATARTLDEMQAAVNGPGRLRCDRWEGNGLGFLRYSRQGRLAKPQPVFNSERTRLVAMAGEIFGDDETLNPAETCLRRFDETGAAGMDALNGSFALMIYEPASRQLSLATDRMGTRPLFYAQRGGVLIFGTRFNALCRCSALGSPRLNFGALCQFLTFEHVFFTDTYLEEISALPPGSIATLSPGSPLRIERYRPVRYRPAPWSEEEAAHRLADALRSAGRRRTSGTERLGLMLSGGIDSRVVAAVSEQPMTAYTLGDWRNREVRLAERVAQTRGWPHRFLQREPDHYARIVDEAIETSGGMWRCDHSHFIGLLDRPSAECDALFIEEPMDGLFKGYYWTGRRFIRGSRMPTASAPEYRREDLAGRMIRDSSRSIWPTRPWLLLAEPLRARCEDALRAGLERQFADAQTDDPLHLIEHASALSNFGRCLTAMPCVRPHIQDRALSLDAELVDLALRMPVEFRKGGRALRQALKIISPELYAIPYGATGLRLDASRRLAWCNTIATHAGLLIRRRLGIIPRTWREESWPDRGELLRTPAMRSLLNSTLLNPKCLPPELFDSRRVRLVLDRHLRRRRDDWRTLFGLLTFGKWFEKYGPGRIAS